VATCTGGCECGWVRVNVCMYLSESESFYVCVCCLSIA